MMHCPVASRTAMLELSICVAVFGIGCYGPNPNYLGASDLAVETSSDASEGSESGVEGGESSTSTGTDTSVETSTDTTDTEAETETETETDTADTDDPDPSCSNQIAEAGEFCFEFVQLLALPEVQALATADFDGDALLDIAVTRKDDVLVLFGDGSGGFPFQTNLPEPNSNYFGVTGGELDGDQLADLVVAKESSDSVLVYRSLGGGAFADPLEFATGDQPQRLALTDLDGDETLDLVVAVKGQDRVQVLLGDGDAGFGMPTSFPSGGDQPSELSLGLFDPDSAPDLVVGNVNGKSLAVLLGAGAGEFASAQVFPLAGKPRSTAIADFNLDGHLDVAAALEDLDRVQILHGDGLGGLVDQGVELPVGNRPMGAVASDFDLDGVPDLLVLNHDDASVGLLFGVTERPGQFYAQLLLVWFNGFASMSAVVSADLNGDEIDDVIIGGGAGVRAMISDP
jgi:hypothetical protein